jgi:hypothetical protein
LELKQKAVKAAFRAAGALLGIIIVAAVRI